MEQITKKYNTSIKINISKNNDKVDKNRDFIKCEQEYYSD